MNQDCAELLFKTNREIKSLNYKLMRVITSDDNYHTVLHPHRTNEIEVIEQTPIVCKVNVKGMLSPVKFSVTFKTMGGGANGVSDSRTKSLKSKAA
jgi:hypothetical protein